MEESALIRKLQKGNTGALDALIRRYTPYVSACAYRVMGHLPREELEEVVADTFVELWRHAADLDPERSSPPPFPRTSPLRQIFSGRQRKRRPRSAFGRR